MSSVRFSLHLHGLTTGVRGGHPWLETPFFTRGATKPGTGGVPGFVSGAVMRSTTRPGDIAPGDDFSLAIETSVAWFVTAEKPVGASP